VDVEWKERAYFADSHPTTVTVHGCIAKVTKPTMNTKERQ
jgi:hypothetical protein